ncbi:MAG: 4-hydroxy-3-methylbut-2-en-1-yl diphosphate synthase [Spirochaetae bacterium HGW-Spirochaetae-1]|nr:MAG: 4-hydroxy-3-methylbut-2-en-1-yl diphosphate synthase [Spirochaetae bacterium HGW-Spirochaetae-1]
MRKRRETRAVRVGSVVIGGAAPISIQSMTSVPIEDVQGTIGQIRRLEEQGADIVRLALRNVEAVEYLREIRKSVSMMLTADIHFNYRIALEAIKAGVNKVRINPGNIGDESRVSEVVRAAKDHGVPIRIGVNAGSVDRKKYPHVTPESLVESAMEHVEILERNNFEDIIVSIKSSDVFQTIEANRMFSLRSNYPLHIGLTEAGYGLACVVQSSIAIGHLLLEGIGDTIRVSMTGDPVEEVLVAKRILETVGERNPLIRLVSCPTCGRTDTALDILQLARDVEERCNASFGDILRGMNKTITVAVMGCEVNGPGEASEADFGLAGAREGNLLLFARGSKIRKVSQAQAVDALLEEIRTSLSINN